MTDLDTLLTRLSTVDENTSREELAELGAQVLTRLSGEKHIVRSWEPSRDIPGGKISIWKTEGEGNRLARNPVTNLNAVKALEREYGRPSQIYFDDECVTVLVKHNFGEHPFADAAKTEEAARCMALLKAVEARD